MKKTVITAIILIILIVIGYINYQKPEEAAIKIGAIIPETGFGSYWGAPVRKGIELAEKDLQVTFPDKKIDVIIEDSQSAATHSASAAQKLITINNVDALYSEFSGPSAAISPIAKSSDKVFIYSTFNQEIASDNPTSLKTFISFEVACGDFAKYLNNSTKKILIISSIAGAGPYCAQALQKYLPEENVKSIEGFTGNDFKTLLLQNKQFAPNYIVPIMYEDGSHALIKQNHELGLGYSFFCYKQDCVTDKLLRELPHAATENIIYFEVPIDETFIAKIRAAHPSITNDDIQAAANAYQSIFAMAEGLVACENKDATCVTNVLANKNLTHAGYKNTKFVDRVLSSDLTLNVVRGGKGELIK